MAGTLPASFCRRISDIAIILLWSLLILIVNSGTEGIPCSSYLIEDENSKQYRSEGDVMLFLQEECETEFNRVEIENFILSEHSNSGLIIDIMPTELTCDTTAQGLEALVHIIGQRKRRAVIATLNAENCEIAGKFAHLSHVPLFTWTCPLKDPREQDASSSMIRLSPSLPSLANALAQLFIYLHWNTAVLISIDCEPWSSLERAVTKAFEDSGIMLRQKIVLAQHVTPRKIQENLRPIRKLPRKATVLCLPATNEQSETSAVLMELDRTIRASKHRFAIVLVQTQEDNAFLPRSAESSNDDSGEDSAISEDYETVSNEGAIRQVEYRDRIGNVSGNGSTETLNETESEHGTRINGTYTAEESEDNLATNLTDQSPPMNSSLIENYKAAGIPRELTLPSEKSSRRRRRRRRRRRYEYSKLTPSLRFDNTSSSERSFEAYSYLDYQVDRAKSEETTSSSSKVTVGDVELRDRNRSESSESYYENSYYLTEGEVVVTEMPIPRSRKVVDHNLLSPGNLSAATMNSLLVLAPLDQRYDIEKVSKGSVYYGKANLLDRLKESLLILKGAENVVDASKNKMYNYALMNWREENWNPILVAVEATDQRISIRRLAGTELFLIENVQSLGDAECEIDIDIETGGVRADETQCVTEDPGDVGRSELPVTHIVSVSLGSLLLTLIFIASVIFIRGQLLRRRMSKGPYKIILTTSDFVFPQVAQLDSRGVDEGIETMLCCWLQQLQEFGGPEVEKPDLLQLGSIGSLRPYLQSSTGNLARNTFLKDPRARYNGDLVQLKELPHQGAFELKAKAMTTLVTIHGLRHENLNPLIGCLNEPTRPCLVYDYCSRGSLEDVLMQDEIKLDWSFRLSLLTDLVRGMRYLHGTPIRVHGYLTSRNCVIDARWVLKLTDYGLPAFYEAQGICPPAKSARDLLWSAPELLRQPSLRRKGTQPGDVYSFGIIMQEVVVRGEPFCMLALSPDEIIDKVMRPPPLIRPSVSKGAAPPEAINIMRQCWAESPDMRPDFNNVHDLFKKLNHGRKVNFMDTMFQMLEKYSNNLEELIRERTEQLDMEKKKTEQLLNRMLPSSVAEKLKLGMPVDPEEFSEVTIYFSDIVGFTTISANSTPFQVVDLLNDLYTCFDDTINAYNVYKVETIGDAYMVVAGCPVRIPDHATQIATMALDLLHQSGKFRLRHLPKTQLRLRIGLHTGPCCAGVVGLTMPRYCLFGDTVNTASRMESTGAPWRIHMSEATHDRLVEAGGYCIEYRGKTDIKGKGKMPTYWLLGKQGFDKQLPVPPSLGLTSEGGMKPTRTTHEASMLESRSSLLNVSSDISKDEDYEGRDVFTETDVGAQSTTILEEGETKIESRRTDRTNTVVVTAVEIEESCEQVEQTDMISASTISVGNTVKGQTVDDEASCVQTGKKPVHFSTNEQTDTLRIKETASSVLGASTTSLTSISSSAASGLTSLISSSKIGVGSRQWKPPVYGGIIDANDLSTPYNQYKCLSPNEHTGRGTGCRLLKRQFSLDRPDEPTAAAIGGIHPSVSSTADQHHQHPIPRQYQYQAQKRTPLPRLHKQNSAGAANDLERIEEIPTSPRTAFKNYRHAASVSLSVESLSFR